MSNAKELGHKFGDLFVVSSHKYYKLRGISEGTVVMLLSDDESIFSNFGRLCSYFRILDDEGNLTEKRAYLYWDHLNPLKKEAPAFPDFDFKIRVDSEKHSFQIQQWCFDNGCTWPFMETTPQYTHRKFLIVSDKVIRFASEEYFMDHENKEIFLTVETTPVYKWEEAPENLPKREIVIDGHTYRLVK